MTFMYRNLEESTVSAAMVMVVYVGLGPHSWKNKVETANPKYIVLFWFPLQELRQGNVFTSVCLFTKEVVSQVRFWRLVLSGG